MLCSLTSSFTLAKYEFESLLAVPGLFTAPVEALASGANPRPKSPATTMGRPTWRNFDLNICSPFTSVTRHSDRHLNHWDVTPTLGDLNTHC